MAEVPAVPGVLTAHDIAATADSIERVQLPSGAIPWVSGGLLDPWDHVQAAMGLAAAGRRLAAERAYDWLRRMQRGDGSWAMRYRGDDVEDAHTESNFCAYLATGVWHHWLLTGDLGFVAEMWPAVERGVDAALMLQRVDGAVAWARGEHGPEADALLTGNASIHLSLRCALALAELVDIARPDLELAAVRLRHVVDHHEERFAAKATHAMDWYYPVLGGALPLETASKRISSRWDEFVVDELGCRCVSTNPWVTGAETCELVLALDVIGRDDEAHRLFAAIQHLRDPDGSYWTGLVYDENVRWPVERSTWTAGTVILATDALSRTTAAHGLFRGEGLPTISAQPEVPCPL